MKIKSIFLIIAMLVILTACGGKTDAADTYTPPALDSDTTYYADIDIKDYGLVTVQLNQEAAPVSAANFVKLAEEGFYDGLTFHRIIADFMIQGGDPEGNGTGGSEGKIVGEFKKNGYDNELSHTRGAISMARSNDKNSASSQFFIVHQDNDQLDGKYAVFGYVINGIEVVDDICATVEPMNNNGVVAPEDKPIINSIKIRTK
jgi:peptidyl-prolyl cis-trans isomerase B (cyclophilin B)